MGGVESKPEPKPKPEPEIVVRTKTVYVDRPVPVRPKTPPQPWRKIYNPDFTTTADFLRGEVSRHRDTRLNLVLIGHSGAGKSSFINSIFSISRGRITSKVSVKSDDISGVGSFHFSEVKARSRDLFQKVRIFDTMGFTGRIGDDDKGITMDDLKAVCEGRVAKGHRFNEGATEEQSMKELRPHCIIFVVSAEGMENLSQDIDTAIRQKLDSMYKIVPNDVARIAVLTKVDRVCDDTYKDIQNIYRSNKILSLVKKVQSIFGVQENEVFPVVNFVTEMEVEAVKSVPLLYAIKFALDYAQDRNEDDEDDD